MMHTHDNFHHATDLSNKATEFLSKRSIPPTPISFSVLYTYYSNRNDELNEALDNQLADKHSVDSIFIEMLFDKYMSNTGNLETELLSPLEDTLNETLHRIDSHVENEAESLIDLKKADKALAQLSQHKSLHSIVNFLVKSVEHAQKQRKTLAKELTKTSSEVNTLKSQLEESRLEASIDSLTGLLNRRGCEDRLKNIDINQQHSSLIIDIDHFKQVNDNFGHFIGDKVIQHIAKIIDETVEDEDVAVRYGGEEFLVVMVNKSVKIAQGIAEKIRTSVEKLKLVQRQTNTPLPTISVSIGLAEIEHNVDNDWLSLFKRTDDALYQAKNSGRNCCIVAEPEMAF